MWGASGNQKVSGVPHAELPAFMSRYRFFFNPIRYTSMGLAVIEAMMVGLPEDGDGHLDASGVEIPEGSDAQVAKWETTRIIDDPKEYEAANATRGRARHRAITPPPGRAPR